MWTENDVLSSRALPSIKAGNTDLSAQRIQRISRKPLLTLFAERRSGPDAAATFRAIARGRGVRSDFFHSVSKATFPVLRALGTFVVLDEFPHSDREADQ